MSASGRAALMEAIDTNASQPDAGLPPSERLRRRLRSGRFLLTAELESPRGASASNVRRQTHAYAPYVEAIDCTDNSAATVRLSAVAATAIAASELSPKLSPNQGPFNEGPFNGAPLALMQLTCRDRNRLALQAEALGAAAVGAAGIVCLGGDPPAAGDHPAAMAVYDLTTPQLIAAIRGLCDGHLLSGERVRPAPDLVVGCVENPAAGERSLERLAAKADAGAEFVQTQITFDVEGFARWMEGVRAAELHERLRIIVGVAPVRRLAVARFLQERVEGVNLPAASMRRLEQAADVETEGVAIAAEVLRAARAIPGVAGAHIMTFGWADGVRRVVEAAGA